MTNIASDKFSDLFFECLINDIKMTYGVEIKDAGILNPFLPEHFDMIRSHTIEQQRVKKNIFRTVVSWDTFHPMLVKWTIGDRKHNIVVPVFLKEHRINYSFFRSEQYYSIDANQTTHFILKAVHNSIRQWSESQKTCLYLKNDEYGITDEGTA